METLDKHRGKGQQKVTVEHVHVEAGGQAVVGNVTTNKSSQAQEEPVSSSTKAIARNPGEIIDMAPAGTRQKAKRKIRKPRR